jgi:hypothetical protein
MRKQIVLTLVISLVLCSLMIGQEVGRATGSGLGVSNRLYAGNGSPTTVQIYPTNDAYVSSEEPNNSAGTQPYLYVYTNGDEYRSLLKFSLSSVPDDAEVQSATLKVLIDADHWPWSGAGASVEARAVTNDVWSESTITWNNQPPYGSLLDTVTQSFYDDGEMAEEWWEWNVATWVSSELSGDKTASFCLKATENQCWFCAGEYSNTSKRPYLEVTYTVPESENDPTTLAVSPASFTLESGQGTTLTATLTSDGTPLAGKTVTWTRTAGALSAASGTTDSSGQVSVTYTAPAVSTQTTVTVTASFAGDNQYQSSSGNSSGTVTAAVDTDGDGMPDNWETQYGLNPNDPDDADDDLDNDNLANLGEYQKGTDPSDSDTDNDEMPDGWEAANSLDPLTDDATADPDGDGYTNLQEYQAGTDPNLASSYPGASNGEEGEQEPAGGVSSYLLLIAVAVIAMVGAIATLAWLRARRGGEEWESEWEDEATARTRLKVKTPQAQS